MSKSLLVVNGNPDPRPERFCAAICDAYTQGAVSGGWDVGQLDLGLLNFAPDASPENMQILAAAIEQIRDADRLAIVFPLWLDGPPGSLHELFERASRAAWTSNLSAVRSSAYEKPARLIVTMDMPAFIQRPRARADGSTKAAFALPGLRCSEPLFIGSLQTLTRTQCEECLEKMRLLGTHED